jgi:peptidoglycan/xylan/chitin deacetylase (PgdA/CDA1 family)
MALQRKKILFSVDLEEFDIPEEYGHAVPAEQKLQVSMLGMQKLDALMDKHGVRATIFTTAFWATQFPDYMKQLAAKHEIASHTFYHNSFKTEDLASSRKVLSDITEQEVVGLRMPRMQDISRKDVKDAGYVYDSSLHPTWLPGRYNHFTKPRTLFQNEGIWELPASVTPVMRIPIFWLAFKNFPLGFYKTLCKRILNHDGYILFYVHPWEFTDLSAYPLPGIVKKIDGEALLQRLDRLFTYLGKQGEFIPHKRLLEMR